MQRGSVGSKRLWSAAIRHRFRRWADLSATQSPDSEEGLDACSRVRECDGDESPAQSGDESPHSKVIAARLETEFDPASLPALAAFFAVKKIRKRFKIRAVGHDSHYAPASVDLVYLCGAALLAGFVDSIVGGGGLIQLPALFIFLPPELSLSTAAVFGTNKLSSLCGTSVAAVQYSRRIPVNWKSILPAGFAAFVFSFLGARLVSMLDGHALRPLILFLLVAVALHTYRRKDFGNLHAPQFIASHERQWGIVLGIAIGFYDGFFGPGTGSFLLFVFIGVFGFDFLTASASAKVINLATNLAAVAYFGATQNILYEYALPMGLCNILGSVAGTRLAILKGNHFVRAFFLLVVSAMILRFGYDVLVSGLRAVP